MNIYHVFLLDFPFLIDLFVCGVRFVWEKLGSVLIQETCVGFSTATTPGTRQVLYMYLYLYLYFFVTLYFITEDLRPPEWVSGLQDWET